MTESPPRILVSIATYNERDNLAPLLHEIHAALPAGEVLVIDDNSPDGTGRLADDLAARDSRIHVLHRAGKLGGLAAWLGFTLPSAVALTVLALWARNLDLAGAGWVHGLELAAAAVVLTAVIAMARTLARGPIKAAIAIAATAIALLWPGTFGQLSTIIVAGVVGGLTRHPHPTDRRRRAPLPGAPAAVTRSPTVTRGGAGD